MKIIAYFVFTLLSIFIQFCVMDFIQEKMLIGKKPTDLNGSSQKVQFSNIIKNISESKSHAVFYNIKASGFTWNNAVAAVNDLELINQSVGPTTDKTTGIFDFYEENSTTDFTTDVIMITTEVDNVTEITLFNTNNQSSKGITPEKKYNKDCSCNFLYNICDINCCCDFDCNDDQRKLFSCSSNKNNMDEKFTKNCYHFIPQNNIDQGNIFNSLFCVVKTNLPDKRIVKKGKTKLEKVYKWTNTITRSLLKLDFNINNTNEYIWILNKESVNYMDIPTSFINNYCMDRQPVKTLQRLQSVCNVKLNDLEMFNILNIFEEGTVINPIENTINHTALNCSTFICVSCNIMACDNNLCATYNRSIHEPTCTENVCINMALKIHFLFYYNEMKITNVTIKLYMENISMAVPFVTQEVNVDFLLGNITEDNVVEFSGTHGYLSGRPIIISHEEGNHSEHFYKHASSRFYFRRPDNVNAICAMNNNSNHFIRFGINKRTKCRLVHAKKIASVNYTKVCEDIQESIKATLYLRDSMFVSPYGNPLNVKDDDWVQIKKKDDSMDVTGEIDLKTSKLNCYNIGTSISFVFAYENMENRKGNKILQAEYELLTQNKSFDVDDISCVINVDVFFVDLSPLGTEEYAEGPYANIGLPKGFFYPFPSNRGNVYYANQILTYCIPIVIFK